MTVVSYIEMLENESRVLLDLGNVDLRRIKTFVND